MKIHKKSQLKMMETLLILLIFVFLLGLVLMLYMNLSKASTQKSEDEKIELRSVEIAQTVSFMSELQCSAKNVAEDNCFDILKVRMLAELALADPEVQNKYYYDIFEFSKVSINLLYPAVPSNLGVKYVIYDRKKRDYVNRTLTDIEPRAIIETNIPTTVYDSLAKKTYFGVLTVETYKYS